MGIRPHGAGGCSARRNAFFHTIFSVQFSGGCEYILAQTDYGVDNSFAVWLDNSECLHDEDTCHKSLIIKFWGGSVFT